jgi:hypothetical protein
MKLELSRIDMWTATIEDRAGGAADKLEPLAKAGVDLEFAFARRTPEQPAKGVLFVTPVKGRRAIKAAQDAGLEKSAEVCALRIEGANQPGVTAKMVRALANAGISFRALSAAAVGRKFVAYLALDTAEDGARANAVLKKLS